MMRTETVAILIALAFVAGSFGIAAQHGAHRLTQKNRTAGMLRRRATRSAMSAASAPPSDHSQTI
jgi:hypothetical protein